MLPAENEEANQLKINYVEKNHFVLCIINIYKSQFICCNIMFIFNNSKKTQCCFYYNFEESHI